jgi:hypothetical protein
MEGEKWKPRYYRKKNLARGRGRKHSSDILSI